MTRARQIGIGVAAAMLFLIALLPLSVALPLVTPPESGLSARRASGTIWSGTLHDARVAGMALGDTRVGLRALPLLVGEAQTWFEAPLLRGIIIASGSGFGMAHGNGAVDVDIRVKPLPLSQLTLDDASVRFTGNRCAGAEGRVRASVTGDIGGLALPGGMSGTLRCDGSALLIPLVGQSGMERLDLRVTGDGKWRAELSVRSTDPAVAAKLVAAGFTPGPGGYAIHLSGAL
jgi:general secretion pathway protein N